MVPNRYIPSVSNIVLIKLTTSIFDKIDDNTTIKMTSTKFTFSNNR